MVCCRLLKKEEEADLKTGGNECWFQDFTISYFWHQAAESGFFSKVKLGACLRKPIKDDGHIFKSGTWKLLVRGQERVFPPLDPIPQKRTPGNVQRWLVYRTSRRAGFQKTACLGLKCIFLRTLSSKQAWNCKQNSKPLWLHLIFTESPLRFEGFNPKAVKLGRFTQNLVKGYLKELQTPKDVENFGWACYLQVTEQEVRGLFQGFQRCRENVL